MTLPSLKNGVISGKRILLRFDGDVPFEDGKISDTYRLDAVIPTLRYCLEQQASVVLLGHRGRPKGKDDPELSNKPVAEYLSQQLNEPVQLVASLLDVLPQQKLVMLENLRYQAGEESNDLGFARLLAKMGDVYCNDAFAVSHRAHASVAALPGLLPHFAGLRFEEEVTALSPLISGAEAPYMVVLGGAKASDKSPIIADLIGKVDGLIIGGLIAVTYLAATGCSVGVHQVEKAQVDLARQCIRRFNEEDIAFDLPIDIITQNREVKLIQNWGKDDLMLDIGPLTQEKYAKAIAKANTVFWNGAMGKFEEAAFASGTLSVARAISQSGADARIASGGDTVSAIHKFNLENGFTFISTGGGATLEFIAGRELPGIKALVS